MAQPTFIFGGDTGVSDPQELARRREVINALISASTPRPRTFGEGLSAIGDAIGSRIADKRLREEERAAREAAKGQFSAITGQLMGGGGRYGMPAQMSRPVPDPNSPAGIGDATMQALGKIPSNGTPITQQDIVRGLTARGLPAHVAAGFAVNAQDESALNPAAQEANPLVAGSRGGGGLMQWTGPRRVALEQYAQQRGMPWTNAELQMDFLAQEMQGSEAQAGNAIMSTQDAPSAAQAIVEQFLRPAPQHMNARVGAYTQDPQVLAQLANLSNNQYAGQGMQMIAQQLLEQQLAQMRPQDPMRNIELQKAQLELQQMQQPQTPEYRMLTPQEAQQMGLPDGAYQVGADGKVTAIGGGGTTVNVGAGEGEFDKTIAKADATALSDLQKAGLDANAGIATLGAMESAMADPNFYSGSAAGSVEAMRRAAVSLGIADPSSVTSMESFGALAKGAALAAMGGSLGAGFSNADRDFVEKQVPTLGNTPEGNASIIRIQKSLLRRKQELAALAQEYAAEQAANGQRFTQTGFEKRAREFAEANPLFADQAQKTGKRLKFNPETGELE